MVGTISSPILAIVDQSRSERFAKGTADEQFYTSILSGPPRTAFGGTVAHGVLTLRCVQILAYNALPRIEGGRAWR